MTTPVMGDGSTQQGYYSNQGYSSHDNNDNEQGGYHYDQHGYNQQHEQPSGGGAGAEGSINPQHQSQNQQTFVPVASSGGSSSSSQPVYRNASSTSPSSSSSLSRRGFKSTQPAFLYPMLVGVLLFFCWLITNLVLESGNSAAQFADGVPPFVVQISTFAIATCLAWYAVNVGGQLYFAVSAVFNYIIVSMYLIHIVGPWGFFAWRANESSLLGACFPPVSVPIDTKLCDAYKATSIFSLFVMLVHFAWMILHAMQGISAFKMSRDLRGILVVTSAVNLFAFLLWWAGVIANADQNHTVVTFGEMEYILILSIALCTCLSILFVLTSHSDVILTFGTVWHVAVAAMLWSTQILVARTSDNGTLVATAAMVTHAGGAIAAAGIIFMISLTISAVVFTLYKFGIMY